MLSQLWKDNEGVCISLNLTLWSCLNRGVQRVGPELPHCIESVAIIRCYAERKRDVGPPLAKSTVAGLSIDFSSRNIIPRTLVRFHFSGTAASFWRLASDGGLEIPPQHSFRNDWSNSRPGGKIHLSLATGPLGSSRITETGLVGGPVHFARWQYARSSMRRP